MANAYGFDGLTPVAVPTLSAVNEFTGAQTFNGDIASTSTSTGTVVIIGGLGVQGTVYGGSVYGCMWNDLTDAIEVPQDTELEYGYCYCFDGEKYYKSDKYLADGFIGIHSNTSGFEMGKKPEGVKTLDAAVAGFVLAYVDQEYKPGTPLTCGENGYLTKLKEEDFILNAYKLVATFWKPEKDEEWGPDGQKVKVNNRMWVKVV